MNPIQIFTNLSALFGPAINLVMAIIGFVGLWFGYKSLYDAFRHAKGDNVPGMIPKEGILPVLFLSGAAIVVPVILWRGANTFVLGGDVTNNLFAYIQENHSMDTTCNNLSTSITELCMLFGMISIFMALRTLYNRVSDPGRGHSMGTPIIYFISGIFLFFITDFTTLLSNTIGMQVGISSICTAIGS